MKIINTEIVDGLSNEDYHASEYVSNSKLSQFIASPQRYYQTYVAKTLPKEPATPAMVFGTRLHDMILEGGESRWIVLCDGCKAASQLEYLKTVERYSNVVVPPSSVLNEAGHRKGKAYTEWARQNEGREIVSADTFAAMANEIASMIVVDEGKEVIPAVEYEQLCRMRDAMKSHKAANGLLFDSNGENELTIRGQDEETGTWIQVRVDRLSSGFIADLKTTAAANPRSFEYSISDYGYHRQKFIYQQMVESLTGDRLPFFFVAVEKKQPHHVEVFDLDDEWDEIAEAEVDKALRAMIGCQTSGVWQPPHYGSILTLQVPRRLQFQSPYEVSV